MSRGRGKTQRAILEAVRGADGLTVAQLADAIYPDGWREVQKRVVRRSLVRLVDEGFIERRCRPWARHWGRETSLYFPAPEDRLRTDHHVAYTDMVSDLR